MPGAPLAGYQDHGMHLHTEIASKIGMGEIR